MTVSTLNHLRIRVLPWSSAISNQETAGVMKPVDNGETAVLML